MHYSELWGKLLQLKKMLWCKRWEFIKILKLSFFLGQDLVYFLFFLERYLVYFLICQDLIFFLFFLIKILFSFYFFLVKILITFFFSWSKSCYLCQDRVFFLFAWSKACFLSFLLKSFFYKFPPQFGIILGLGVYWAVCFCLHALVTTHVQWSSFLS